MTSYWIGVAAADHVKTAQRDGICAFSQGQEAAVGKLSPGDRFAYYCRRTGIREGDTVQAFAALGTDNHGEPDSMSWADGRFPCE